jgi:hypothetical protein
MVDNDHARYMDLHFTYRLHRLLTLGCAGYLHDHLINVPRIDRDSPTGSRLHACLGKVRNVIHSTEAVVFDKHTCSSLTKATEAKYADSHVLHTRCQDLVNQLLSPTSDLDDSLRTWLLDLGSCLVYLYGAPSPTLADNVTRLTLQTIRDIMPSLVTGYTLCNRPGCPGRCWLPCFECDRFRTLEVTNLARSSWTKRPATSTTLDQQSLSITADWLEDHACPNTDLIAHLRSSSHVHRPGCWAVDLVMGKRPVSAHLSFGEYQ